METITRKQLYPKIDTPALLVDLDILEQNIQQMAEFFANIPAGLRPHSKTHKCPEIARRQIQAGAIGVTCAKLGEATVMADAGIQDILIANQVTGSIKIEKLADLANRCELMAAVDDPDNVQELSQACAAKGAELRVLVEIDIGMGRCGVQPGIRALELARLVAASPNLVFKGLMGYEGHLVLTQDPQERKERVEMAFAPLLETRTILEKAGLKVEIVSGGGTGTYDITGVIPGITEIQSGSYVFMDSTYHNVRTEFMPALTVLTGVVSTTVKGRVVVDAGLKAMTKEFGWPTPLDCDGATVEYLSEEHGVLSVADPDKVIWQPGDRIRFLPSHCCTTVNLYNVLHIVRDNHLVDIWPVSARGCAQ
ncbi:MAG: DSD1 family PLP-dependent enzyme [Anaerolineales bacterium]|nr:DSD1 family PLP-dependent enzyme [Anaerolineales bacterium]